MDRASGGVLRNAHVSASVSTVAAGRLDCFQSLREVDPLSWNELGDTAFVLKQPTTPAQFFETLEPIS